MSYNKKRSAKGFTLVELLVVIGIIAVLISILLPALNKARLAANKAYCLSNLRQMQMASEQYANENQGWYIPVLPIWDTVTPTNVRWWFQNEAARQSLSLLPYKIYYDPGQPPSGYYDQADARRICKSAIYALNNPDPTGMFSLRNSYGMNYTQFMDPLLNDYWLYSATRPKTWAGYKAAKIRNSSSKIAWADSLSAGFRKDSSSGYVGEMYPSPNDQIAYRHDNGANVIFFDGHGDWLPRREIDKNYLSQQQIDLLWYPYK